MPKDLLHAESRLPLGLLLLSRGCISHAQLQLALERQRERGGALGDVLCELNFCHREGGSGCRRYPVGMSGVYAQVENM